MKDKIFQICNQLEEQGIKPTLERVRNELGSGSFSTINPILKQWKDSKEINITAENIELPNDVAAIGQRATALIWKTANDHCNEIIKAVRHETDQLIEQANTERNEALAEINRLEHENERLLTKTLEDSQIINQLTIQAALANNANETISTLRAELEAAQKQTAKLEGMLLVYESIGKQTEPTPEPTLEPKPTQRKTKAKAKTNP